MKFKESKEFIQVHTEVDHRPELETRISSQFRILYTLSQVHSTFENMKIYVVSGILLIREVRLKKKFSIQLKSVELRIIRIIFHCWIDEMRQVNFVRLKVRNLQFYENKRGRSIVRWIDARNDLLRVFSFLSSGLIRSLTQNPTSIHLSLSQERPWQSRSNYKQSILIASLQNSCLTK